MADYDLIVRNGRIVTEDRQIDGDVPTTFLNARLKASSEA